MACTSDREKVSKFEEKYRIFDSQRICVVACCFTHGRQEEKRVRRGRKDQNEEEVDDGGGMHQSAQKSRIFSEIKR